MKLETAKKLTKVVKETEKEIYKTQVGKNWTDYLQGRNEGCRVTERLSARWSRRSDLGSHAQLLSISMEAGRTRADGTGRGPGTVEAVEMTKYRSGQRGPRGVPSQRRRQKSSRQHFRELLRWKGMPSPWGLVRRLQPAPRRVLVLHVHTCLTWSRSS